MAAPTSHRPLPPLFPSCSAAQDLIASESQQQRVEAARLAGLEDSAESEELQLLFAREYEMDVEGWEFASPHALAEEYVFSHAAYREPSREPSQEPP